MSEESMRLIKFDGNETNWYQWSVKTLALAKARGFRTMYSKNHNPCSDEEYEVETDKGVRAIYEANDKAYQPVAHHELHRNRLRTRKPSQNENVDRWRCIHGVEEPRSEVCPPFCVGPDPAGKRFQQMQAER